MNCSEHSQSRHRDLWWAGIRSLLLLFAFISSHRFLSKTMVMVVFSSPTTSCTAPFLTIHSDYVYLHVYPHLYALSLSTSVSIYPSLNLLSLQSTYPYLSLPLSLSSSVSIYPSFSLLSLYSTYPYLSLPLSLSSSVSIYLNLLSLHLTSFSDTPWTQTQVGVGGQTKTGVGVTD